MKCYRVMKRTLLLNTLYSQSCIMGNASCTGLLVHADHRSFRALLHAFYLALPNLHLQ